MDPATAFAVACGTIQIIDFGFKVVKNYREISHSITSSTLVNERIDNDNELLAKTADGVKKRLLVVSSTGTTLTGDKRHLESIAEGCSDLAKELRDAMGDLKPSSTKRSRDKLRTTWKSFRNKSQIEEIHKRLQRYQHQLDSANLLNLCHDLDKSSELTRRLLEEMNLVALKNSEVLKQMQPSLQSFVSDIQRFVDTPVLNVSRRAIRVRPDESSYIESDGNKTRAVIQDYHDAFISQQKIKALLDSLSFPTIHSRQEDIHPRYEKTFGWIFGPRRKAERRTWPNFVQWLEQEPAEIYWISGRLGSGKSTLMKFIVESREAQKSLAKWAGASPLVTPNFFFWHSGTAEQKSMSGMLSSLIYQILERHKGLAPIAFQQNPSLSNWSTSSLYKTLRTLIKQTNIELKYCFFIDGVDEFSGNDEAQENLIGFIKEISKMPRTKVCLASRPESKLRDNFVRYPHLRLQELTEKDIHRYVVGMLSPKCYSRGFSDGQVHRILSEVQQKAEGVFLWVYLVVQDLLRGLQARDTFGKLEERLELLPSDLESLFVTLIERIDRVHRASGAKYLRYARLKTPLSLLHFSLLGQPEDRVNLEELQSSNLTRKKLLSHVQRLQDLSVRLREETAGILEVSCTGLTTWYGEETGPPCLLCTSNSSKDLCFENLQGKIFFLTWQHHTVRFAHRSAFDFLQENSNATDFLSLDTTSEDILRDNVAKTCMSIFQSGLFFTNTFPFLETSAAGPKMWATHARDFWQISKEIDCCLTMVRASIEGSEEDMTPESFSMLDFVEQEVNAAFRTHAQFVRQKYLPHSMIRAMMPGIFKGVGTLPPEHLFISHTTKRQLSQWALARLGVLHQTSLPGLYHNLCDSTEDWRGSRQFQFNLRIVSKMLRLGLQPNQDSGSYGRPWEQFISEIFLSARGIPSTASADVVSTIKTFISCGAGINTPMICAERSYKDHKTRLYLRASPLFIMDTALAGADQRAELRQCLIENGAQNFATAVLEDTSKESQFQAAISGQVGIKIFTRMRVLKFFNQYSHGRFNRFIKNLETRDDDVDKLPLIENDESEQMKAKRRHSDAKIRYNRRRTIGNNHRNVSSESLVSELCSPLSESRPSAWLFPSDFPVLSPSTEHESYSGQPRIYLSTPENSSDGSINSGKSTGGKPIRSDPGLENPGRPILFGEVNTEPSDENRPYGQDSDEEDGYSSDKLSSSERSGQRMGSNGMERVGYERNRKQRYWSIEEIASSVKFHEAKSRRKSV
ncbi:MAG: hypothetical protein M1831_005209 [Alyxoria varia]|nr:MAG: hypothetical protein M1831_005209 [Alyxoria varia]